MVSQKNKTKSDKYKLTAAGQKLFHVLINPEHLGKNVDELCQIAKVSRDTYYRLMKDKEFTDLVSATSKELVMAKISDVLNATYIYSLGEKGHQDRKILLTMAGLYVDKKETEISGELNIESKYKDMSDDELKELVSRYERINSE